MTLEDVAWFTSHCWSGSKRSLTGGSLKPHVGHKVEVTGMMKPMAKESMGEGAMKNDGMSKDAMAKDGMMKTDAMGMSGTLSVKNVKMIAATCS